MDSKDSEKPAKFYLERIVSRLPRNYNKRALSRILWLPFHLPIISISIGYIIGPAPSWGLSLLCALFIGHSFACLMFVGHELMHGSILKPGLMQKICATLCFLPYCMSPKQWFTWHNKWHHQKTSLSALDPDSWGSIDTYVRRKEFRIVEALTPGSGLWHSWLFWGYWFFAHGLIVMTVFSRFFHYWDERERKLLWIHIACCMLFWASILLTFGALNFLFIYLIPLAIANGIQMAYIATNHLLMPETKEANDPLRNTLTVKTWRILDLLHLNFSYHIEHHVAPAMSPRYAPLMQKELKESFGARYMQMPHWQAIRLLIKTPQLRLDSQHFVNPRSGDVFGVLQEDKTIPYLGKVSVPVARPRTVLRGSVEIKQAGATPEQKPVVVPAGSTAKVNAMAKAIKPDDATESKEHKAKIAEQPKIAVAQTTKQDLIIIQHSTKVKKAVLPMNSEGENVTASEEEKEIALLENKAVEATLEDIKTYNPKLYETIKAKHGEGEANRIVDVDEIQAETVRALFIDAPSDPGNTKPVLDDLESVDVYEKYKWGDK